jgi:hypothetical protein
VTRTGTSLARSRSSKGETVRGRDVDGQRTTGTATTTPHHHRDGRTDGRTVREEKRREEKSVEEEKHGIARTIGGVVDVCQDDDDDDDDSRRMRGNVVDVDVDAWVPRRIRGKTRAREGSGDEDSGGVTTERVFFVVVFFVFVVDGRGIAFERVRDEETDERRAKANGRG